MKAALYNDKNDDIEILEVDIPEIHEGEILVKPMAVGLCPSELIPHHLKKGGSFGHELSGIVSKIGKGVNGLNEGDRVFIQHHVPCLKCNFCRREHYTMCEHFKIFGFDPTGYAEYTRIKRPNVCIGTIKLPAHISFEEGCLIEPVSCVLGAIKKANIKIGDTILIIGTGFAGLVAIQILKLLNPGLIIVIDTLDCKLEKALKFGADFIINAEKNDVLRMVREVNEGRKADNVLITAPSITAVQMGFELTERGSTIVQFGGTDPHESTSIIPYNFLVNEINYFGSYSSSHIDIHQAAMLIAGGKIRVKPLITNTYPLDQLKEAIECKKRNPESLKIVIYPNN